MLDQQIYRDIVFSSPWDDYICIPLRRRYEVLVCWLDEALILHKYFLDVPSSRFHVPSNSAHKTGVGIFVHKDTHVHELSHFAVKEGVDALNNDHISGPNEVRRPLSLVLLHVQYQPM